jgi:23S rRNA (uracil1939-C5)-methyltransferase
MAPYFPTTRSEKILQKTPLKNFNKPVSIDKIVNGGFGLGRLDDGRIVLVRKVLPDEKVTLTITEERNRYLYADAAAIIEANPARIDPPCPWYGQCGGCDLQHCDYGQQLRIKTGIVRELFLRQFSDTPAGLPVLVQDTLPSPAQFGYRQRIRLQVDADSRAGFLGFGSHTIIPIAHCNVAKDELNTVLAELSRNSSCSRILKNCKEFELLFNPISSGVVCLFHLSRKPRPADIRQAEELTDTIPLLERIFFQGADYPLTGPFSSKKDQQTNTLQMRLPPYEAEDTPYKLSWEVGGFCQVNLGQNERLIRHVLDVCRLRRKDSILDLFCGMGNFSIPFAAMSATLLGIEGQGSAIRSARKNSASAGLANTTFKKGPIHETCRRLAGEGRVFDCVVLDPPRQGVPGLARELAALTCRNLLYISCDPATLCRDLSALTRCGLTIRHIQPVDMFPQTHHIETVVLLEMN